MNQTSMQMLQPGVGAAPWLMPGAMPSAAEPAALKDIPVADLGLRRLTSAADIREISHLRREIDLSAAASADPEFMTREKKETNWALFMLSSCMTAS